MKCEICKEDFIADGFKICIDCQQDETEKNFVQVERRDLESMNKMAMEACYGKNFDAIMSEVDAFLTKYLGKGG